MKVAIIGAGNVGVAIAADLSIKGHEVALIKTSNTKSEVFDRIKSNNNRVFLKENNCYTETVISNVSYDISLVATSDVVFVTVQSIYHEYIAKKIAPYISGNQILVCICSYMSSFYFGMYICKDIPAIVETTGPYLEGRVELEDKEGEVVFRVGCRLSRSPLCISNKNYPDEIMYNLHKLDRSFSNEYNIIESGLLNPNMVLHTVGAIMSIPRIEYSHGNFCMYREAYSRYNSATMNIMLQLDEEKKAVLMAVGCKPIDVFEAGGFSGNHLDSFFKYSESNDRAISPTSVRSRYITEDVSQGLVLLESVASIVGIRTPIATSLIDISGAALNENFRENGRTLQRLGESAENYVRQMNLRYNTKIYDVN